MQTVLYYLVSYTVLSSVPYTVLRGHYGMIQDRAIVNRHLSPPPHTRQQEEGLSFVAYSGLYDTFKSVQDGQHSYKFSTSDSHGNGLGLKFGLKGGGK
jgi:hypothetical protein